MSKRSQMSNHLRRIESVERELKRLEGQGAVKEDVTKLRGEMKKIYVSSGKCAGEQYSREAHDFRASHRTAFTSSYSTFAHMYGASSKTCIVPRRTTRSGSNKRNVSVMHMFLLVRSTLPSDNLVVLHLLHLILAVSELSQDLARMLSKIRWRS